MGDSQWECIPLFVALSGDTSKLEAVQREAMQSYSVNVC